MSERAQALLTQVLELDLDEKMDFADELDSRISDEFPRPPSKFATQVEEDEAHWKMLEERMRRHEEHPEKSISGEVLLAELRERYAGGDPA